MSGARRAGGGGIASGKVIRTKSSGKVIRTKSGVVSGNGSRGKKKIPGPRDACVASRGMRQVTQTRNGQY